MQVLKVILIYTFIAAGLTAQSQPVSAKDLLDGLAESGQVAGVVGGVMADGEITWMHASGVASDNEPMTNGTVLRIASIAKPMTAVALMQLAEKGKIDLDAPVTEVLSDYPQWSEITPRQLLAHTSGIGAYANKKEASNTAQYASIEDAVNIFSSRDLESAPGETYAYTTYGYVVLGLIIEKASGMTYGEYMHQNVFTPAGMQHTYVWGEQTESETISELYASNGKGKIRKDKNTDLSDRIPGGGILSTAEDVLLFANAVMGNKLISRASFDELITDTGAKTSDNAYGMGWYLYGENPRLGNTVGHPGAHEGCSAHFFMFPEHDASLVVIANTSNAMSAVSGTAVNLFNLIAD